jgi:hypothetical protein
MEPRNYTFEQMAVFLDGIEFERAKWAELWEAVLELEKYLPYNEIRNPLGIDNAKTGLGFVRAKFNLHEVVQKLKTERSPK